MKRFLAIALALLLLTGCAAEPPPPSQTVPPTSGTEPIPTEPDGCYIPDHPIEADSDGAFRVYELTQDNPAGLLSLGDDLVLFSGREVTTLTLLSGSTRYPKATVTLECFVTPDSPAVQVSDKGISYYNADTSEAVFLDASLKEVRRLSFSDPVTAAPVLSGNRNLVYYCSGEILKVLDLETGFVRLIRELALIDAMPVALHCGETIIQCEGNDDRGIWHTYFISTQTGETVCETNAYVQLYSHEERYFATVQDEDYRELLSGTTDSSPMSLQYPVYDSTVLPVPELNLVLIGIEDAQNQVTNYSAYDLTSGVCTAAFALPSNHTLWSACGAPQTGNIYFLDFDLASGSELLLQWDPAQSSVSSSESLLVPRYTPENPDVDGLAQCAALADSISQKYCIQIHLWTDAVQDAPWGYRITAEYRVPRIMQALQQLDDVLSRYPEQIFKDTVKTTSDGVIHVSLVRDIQGRPDSGGLDNGNGLQFWDKDGKAHIVLALGGSLEGTIHHELFHVVETRVLNRCTVYDDWEKWNPEEFVYDYDYILNLSRTGEEYLDHENRAFIDTYSMSFPKEDRARIIEYAMQADCAHLFASDIMQQKLQTLCFGIRKAFRLKDPNIAYPWEQYLLEPVRIP